jgi:hypothetical protein
VETHRATEAEPLLREARQIYFAAFGRDHARSARAELWLAVCLVELGEREEAAQELFEAYDVQRGALSLDHPHLLETERAIADLEERKLFSEWRLSLDKG